MEFRRAVKDDIENIMTIIKHGQEYLREQKVNQWQNNYPSLHVINEDIEKGYGYVVEIDSNLGATVAISFDGEQTYNEIFDGDWLSQEEYCVIHRMAIHKTRRGSHVSSFLMESIEKLCKDKKIRSLKVDTHRENLPMQRYLRKHGFQYCGIIYLTDGDERLAFEKILK